MFGKKADELIYMATTSDAPTAYDPIGLVVAEDDDIEALVKKLDREARKVGADGVVGLRLFAAGVGTIALHVPGAWTKFAYGTAVRWRLSGESSP